MKLVRHLVNWFICVNLVLVPPSVIRFVAMSRLQLSSGIDLFYTDDGPPSAPTMIFVHGWSCDSHDWSWHLPAFAGMYRTIAMDLRGHGKTTGSEASYAMTDFATDLAELISMLGVATFVGVGHSMGAMILSELAMSQPGTVRGLVLIDPAYGAPDQVAEQARVAIPTMRGPNGFEALRAQIDALEGPRTPDWLRTWHIRRLLGMSQEVAVTAYAELLVTPAPGLPDRAASNDLRVADAPFYPFMRLHAPTCAPGRKRSIVK